MNLESAEQAGRMSAWVLAAPASRSAAMLASGVLALSIAAAFRVIPVMLGVAPMTRPWGLLFGVGGVALIALALTALPSQISREEDTASQQIEPARSTDLYGMYIVGLGFGLLTMALVCSTIFVGIAWSVSRGGQISAGSQTSPTGGPVEFAKIFGETPIEGSAIVGLFVLSSIVALLGALFFFCTSLWAKMEDPEREPFDRRVFWGGLWFRLGEALLFNLVFFLLLRTWYPERYILLPLVSLLVGMFLKTGESLVAGIATRVFASIQALVPTDLANKSMKLLSLGLQPVDADQADGAVADRLSKLAEAIKALKGVEHVESDAKSLSLRIEFNATDVSEADLWRKVELKGFRRRT